MTSTRIERLIGVYDADGTLLGELAYVVGRALGKAHCALCDITHGTVRARPEWRSCRADLGIAFDTYHRNDQPPPVAEITRASLPAVVARTSTGSLILLLGPTELDRCKGSPERLMTEIRNAAQRLALALD